MNSADIKRALELHDATKSEMRHLATTACVAVYDLLALGALYIGITFLLLTLGS